MKRRILGLVLMLSILAAFVPYVSAATIIASGNCGTYNYDTQDFNDNANWVLDSDGTLTISGNGYIGLCWASKLSAEFKKEIKKLVIEDGITGIGDGAFWGCNNLADVEIADSIIEIGNGALHATLWNSNQPAGPVYAGNVLYTYAGTYDTSLNENTTLNIRSGTVSISNTFADWQYNKLDEMEKITNINFPNTLQIISSRALELTGWYKNQPDGVVYVNNLLYAYKGDMSKVEEVNIKDGTTAICGYAFNYGNGTGACENMKTVYIPTSLRYIGSCAFLWCDSLTDLYYKGTEEQWNNTNIEAINADHGNDAIFNANIHFLGAVTPVPVILNSSAAEKQGSGYRVTAKLQDIPYDCDITAALYSGEKLVGIETVPAIIGENEKTINITASTADSAKIFIWDSLSGMRPLCEAKTVDIK